MGENLEGLFKAFRQVKALFKKGTKNSVAEASKIMAEIENKYGDKLTLSDRQTMERLRSLEFEKTVELFSNLGEGSVSHQLQELPRRQADGN